MVKLFGIFFATEQASSWLPTSETQKVLHRRYSSVIFYVKEQKLLFQAHSFLYRMTLLVCLGAFLLYTVHR